MTDRFSTTADVGVVARRTFRVLAMVAVVLATISYSAQLFRYFSKHDHVFGLIDMFNVSAENSVPTVFSGTQLTLATVSLIAVCLLRITGRSVFPWLVLIIGFMLMTLDELVSIHETLTIATPAPAGSETLHIVQKLWVYRVAPIVVAIALIFIPFLRSLPKETRNGMILAGFIFVFGAVVIEGISLESGYNERHPIYNAIATFEELCEMLGISLFIRTVLLYIASYFPAIALNAQE